MSEVEWEARFTLWSKPPSQAEDDRIQNAIKAIRNALDNDPVLASQTKVFVQGSYRNNVNVRLESDIDVGVLYTGNTFYPYYPSGKSNSDFGNIEGDWNFADFKNELQKALINYFGSASVTRGNKAFDIHSGSRRVDADVVPLFIHRRYSDDGSYMCGVQLFTDDGDAIINWPERVYDQPEWPNQHYENGVSKNSATSRSYKGVVRILKKLRYLMLERKIDSANHVPSFLVECLVWNVPDALLADGNWYDILQNTLSYLWTNTRTSDTCSEWGEVSELKYLFKYLPDSKREQAHAFINDAWSFVGVKS